jgi:calcium-dependent protein kinase
VLCDRNNEYESQNLNPYFTAPELYSKNYTEKCDIWSLGVILYVLLSGFPPFTGQSEKQIQQNAKLGVYSLEGQNWNQVSEKAKNLIRKMICLDVK